MVKMIVSAVKTKTSAVRLRQEYRDSQLNVLHFVFTKFGA